MTDLDRAAVEAMAIPCALPFFIDVAPDGEFIGVSGCGEPSIALAHFACVHEHFETPNVCAGCATDLQHLAGALTCLRCEDGPEPHECFERVWLAWFDGSPVTIVQEVPR